MAAFVAENRVSGYSPSITAVELDALFAGPDRPALVLDLRDPFAFDRGHIEGATNTALSRLEDAVAGISSTDSVLLLSADGKTGHQALRRLRLAGYERVWNLSGGYVSLERHARAVGFANIDVPIHEPEHRESADRDAGKAEPPEATEAASAPTEELGDKDPLVVDVRTPEEYEQGAYPGAVNIPLDELDERIDALGSKEREITVYCASGARSAYAKRMLERAGFDRIENGGGLIDMMSERV
jgi:rhodanese-related sulfurtransferase